MVGGGQARCGVGHEEETVVLCLGARGSGVVVEDQLDHGVAERGALWLCSAPVVVLVGIVVEIGIVVDDPV